MSRRRYQSERYFLFKGLIPCRRRGPPFDNFFLRFDHTTQVTSAHETPQRACHDNPPRADMKSTFSQPLQTFPRIISFLAQIQL